MGRTWTASGGQTEKDNTLHNPEVLSGKPERVSRGVCSENLRLLTQRLSTAESVSHNIRLAGLEEIDGGIRDRPHSKGLRHTKDSQLLPVKLRWRQVWWLVGRDLTNRRMSIKTAKPGSPYSSDFQAHCAFPDVYLRPVWGGTLSRPHA